MDEDAVDGVYTRVPPRSTNSRTNLAVGVTLTSKEPGGELSLFMAFTSGTSSGGNRWLVESDGDFTKKFSYKR